MCTYVQVAPSFFDAPGAELAQLSGKGPQDLDNFALTIVFCGPCHFKVRRLSEPIHSSLFQILLGTHSELFEGSHQSY